MGFVNDTALQGQSYQQSRETVEVNCMDYKGRQKIQWDRVWFFED